MSAFATEPVILPDNMLVNSLPTPTNDEAVIIPLDLISPVKLLIPTPFFPTVFGLDPTWKVNRGSVVPTPTFPSL